MALVCRDTVALDAARCWLSAWTGDCGASTFEATVLTLGVDWADVRCRETLLLDCATCGAETAFGCRLAAPLKIPDEGVVCVTSTEGSALACSVCELVDVDCRDAEVLAAAT